MPPLDPRGLDWEALIPILVLYARAILYSRGFGSGLPSGGSLKTTVEEISFGVMSDVLHAKRKWDPARFPDPLVPLKGMIKSEIDHLLDSWYSRNVVTANSLVREGEDGDLENPIDKIAPDCTSPLDDLVAEEDAVEKTAVEGKAKTFYWEVHNLLKTEPELLKCWEMLLEGRRPQEIAVSMGLSADQIYNMEKRLRRRVFEHKNRIGFRMTGGAG